MVIEIKKNAEETTIEIVGRLDTTTAPVLEATINENVAGVKNLVLDMKGLEYVSSAGLRVLLATHKKMKGALKLKNVCELVMEVFDITGFLDIFNVE